jgi:nucleoporin NUP159
MQYQQPEAHNKSWPDVLKSETPMDALNDEWLLNDITRLHEGHSVLSQVLADSQVVDFNSKIQQCQTLIGHDLFELRTKLTSIRKTLHAISNTDGTVTAPLSAEQASIQNDLRRTSTSVQSKLVQIEDGIALLRARLAEAAPDTSTRRSSILGRTSSQKKPTVEAVTKTVAKMMSMAEQKSADIDVLESQLKRLGISSMNASGISNGDGDSNTTPHRNGNRRSVNVSTPTSAAGSVYHTPDSKFGGSTRSKRSFRSSINGGGAASGMVVSAEDKERWQAQARRKKEAAEVLKSVLEGKRAREKAKTTR